MKNKLLVVCAAMLSLLSLNLYATEGYKIFAELEKSTPPGNIAVSSNGRKFISIHGFYGHKLKLAELKDDGSVIPYPNETWAHSPKDGIHGLHDVLGLNVDENNILWLLDASSANHAGRLIGWDLNNEKLAKIIHLPKPIITDNSFLNDLAVDAKSGYIYIADTAGSEAAIIVVNIKTGSARRVLQGSKFMVSEDIDMVIEGRTIELGGAPARLGVNPITIDPDNKWLYFGAMNGTSIYRIDTKFLRDASLKDAALSQRIQRYGTKPISDGITVDGSGNIYISSITDGSIGVTQSNGKYKTLYKSDDISWPDGFAFGPDNKIYLTVNQLHRSPVLNKGKDASVGKFKVIVFNSIQAGKTGR